MKYDTISSCAPILSIKNSGFSKGGIYIARYEIIDNNLSEKENAYPKYYHNIQKQPAMWFKISEIKPMEYDILTENFVGATSGGDIDKILNSMCPAFFIKSIKNVAI